MEIALTKMYHDLFRKRKDSKVRLERECCKVVEANLLAGVLQINFPDYHSYHFPLPDLLLCFALCSLPTVLLFILSCPICHSAVCPLTNLPWATYTGCSCHLWHQCRRLTSL